MRVLVTGASGQLGRALQSDLAGHEIVACDRNRLDITGPESVRRVLEEERPDLVINTAAYTDVDGAEADASAAYQVNADGAGNVAAASAALGIPLLHVSTDYVFDGEADRPYTEDDPVGPRSVYGASKLAGEDAVRRSNPRHYIVRTAWLYHTVGKNFPNAMLALASRRELRVVDDQFGSPTWAPHLAAGIGRLIATEAWGLYHMAGRGGASRFELAQALFDALGKDVVLRPAATADFPRPAERPRYSVLTTIRSSPILLPPWEEGIEEFARAVAGTGRKGGAPAEGG